jgi:hypothetical protein
MTARTGQAGWDNREAMTEQSGLDIWKEQLGQVSLGRSALRAQESYNMTGKTGQRRQVRLGTRESAGGRRA